LPAERAAVDQERPERARQPPPGRVERRRLPKPPREGEAQVEGPT
jgi:hypothetical protein